MIVFNLNCSTCSYSFEGWFENTKDYNKQIKENIRRIKTLPKLKGVKKILYPGENKYLRYKKNISKKIKVSKIIEKDLKILLN